MTMYNIFQNSDNHKAEISRIFVNGLNNDWKNLTFSYNVYIGKLYRLVTNF